MPMSLAEVRNWARQGAANRLSELAKEMQGILDHFPDLARLVSAPKRRGRPRKTFVASLAQENLPRRGRPRKAVKSLGRRGRPKKTQLATGKRPRKRGKLSEEGRKRIAEAQKARWAARRAAQQAAPEAPKAKRAPKPGRKKSA